jgi:hypothetical protein
VLTHEKNETKTSHATVPLSKKYSVILERIVTSHLHRITQKNGAPTKRTKTKRPSLEMSQKRLNPKISQLQNVPRPKMPQPQNVPPPKRPKPQNVPGPKMSQVPKCPNSKTSNYRTSQASKRPSQLGEHLYIFC